jgi:hypothetical protein
MQDSNLKPRTFEKLQGQKEKERQEEKKNPKIKRHLLYRQKLD